MSSVCILNCVHGAVPDGMPVTAVCVCVCLHVCDMYSKSSLNIVSRFLETDLSETMYNKINLYHRVIEIKQELSSQGIF